MNFKIRNLFVACKQVRGYEWDNDLFRQADVHDRYIGSGVLHPQLLPVRANRQWNGRENPVGLARLAPEIQNGPVAFDSGENVCRCYEHITKSLGVRRGTAHYEYSACRLSLTCWTFNLKRRFHKGRIQF